MSTKSSHVQAWRKRAKAKLIEICGNKCNLCGYDKCPSALEYHHLDPAAKDFAIAGGGITRKFALMVAEIRKCIMVCANCHREIHAGMVDTASLAQYQIHDEEAVNRHTKEVEAAKVVGLIQKGEVRRKIKEEQIAWTKANPNTSSKVKKVDWSQYDVFELLKEHKSYEAVGRLLGVTGAAIKRREQHLLSKK